MPALTLVCLEADYNAATQTCVAPYFAPQETGWPTLSIADAQTIGLQMALVWAVAWGFRRLKKQIDQS